MVIQMSSSPLSQDGQKQACRSKVQAAPSHRHRCVRICFPFLSYLRQASHTWYLLSVDSQYLQAANVSDGAFRWEALCQILFYCIHLILSYTEALLFCQPVFFACNFWCIGTLVKGDIICKSMPCRVMIIFLLICSWHSLPSACRTIIFLGCMLLYLSA